MARATVPLNFNAFLEKAKLKDDGSNYTDWVRNLRIILIAAQKNYVLETPLGDKPAAGAMPDVLNIISSICSRPSTQRCFQDVILLCSNEDNPQVMDPVRVIATIIFQPCFLKERIKIQRYNSTGHLSTNNIDKQNTIRY